jgi:hypothetical protein
MPTYIQGAELDNTTIAWTDADGVAYDFSTGWTFSLKVGLRGQTAVFTKTTGISGGAAVPNVTVVWATTGELNLLEEGTYVLQLEAIRTSDSRSLKMQDAITIIAQVD